MNTKLTKSALRKMDRASIAKLGTDHCLLEHLDQAEVDAMSKAALIEEIGGALLRIEVGEEYTAAATGNLARPVEELIGFVPPPAPATVQYARRTRSAKRADAALARVEPIIAAAAAAEAKVKAERPSRPATDRRNEYTHPDGKAAVEAGPCAKCGAAKAERCFAKTGERTNFVHAPRFKAWETGAPVAAAPAPAKRTRKAQQAKAVEALKSTPERAAKIAAAVKATPKKAAAK